MLLVRSEENGRMNEGVFEYSEVGEVAVDALEQYSESSGTVTEFLSKEIRS